MRKEDTIATLAKLKEIASPDVRGALDHAIQSVEALYTHLVPFAVGSRIRLRVTPEIDQHSGWFPYKHVLVAGAEGTVIEVSWSNHYHKYTVTWLPDDQTYYSDFHKDIRPGDPNRPGHFMFKASSLEAILPHAEGAD